MPQQLTTMQRGHGWRAGDASADAMNDGRIFALGRQSAFIASKPDGTAATLTRTAIAPRLDLTGGRQIGLLVMAENGDAFQDLSLYVSSDGLQSAYASVPIQNLNADPSVRWLKDGVWTWVTAGLGAAAVCGPLDPAAVDSLRLRLISVRGRTATVRLQAVAVMSPPPFAAGGIVCFTYDDSYRSQYAIANAHLARHGFTGTAYTITSNVQAGDAGDARYLTTAMLRQLRRDGWEIGLHTDTVTDHHRAFAGGRNLVTGIRYGTDPLSSAELTLDVDRNLAWLTGNGLVDGVLGHCYPQGRFDVAVQRQLATRVSYARAMTGDTSGMETVPPADPYAIRAYTLNSRSAMPGLRTIVDGVAAHGGLAVFCAHDLRNTPVDQTQCAVTVHQSLVDYVATKKSLKVMPLGTVMRLLDADRATAPGEAWPEE
jgi:peptidoglycan/xylan/chitin deacetylase (PgdA/CDA1 family)